MSDLRVVADYVLKYAPAGSPEWLAAARITNELNAPAIRALLLAEKVEQEGE